MPAGRPRRPTNILELRGGIKHDPGRYANRAHEPKPHEPISTDPPGWMTAGEKRCYRETIRLCHKDVLCSADRATVEMVACLLAEFREGPRKMHIARITRLMAGLGLLGMTPVDRSKVATFGTPDKKNPYAEFGT